MKFKTKQFNSRNSKKDFNYCHITTCIQWDTIYYYTKNNYPKVIKKYDFDFSFDASLALFSMQEMMEYRENDF